MSKPPLRTVLVFLALVAFMTCSAIWPVVFVTAAVLVCVLGVLAVLWVVACVITDTEIYNPSSLFP